MAAFDFDAARRWARFDGAKSLARRADDELPFVSAEAVAGPALLLDTCVYIDQMQGRSPPLLGEIVAQRTVNHSIVAVQELLHAVGALDPDDVRTKAAIAEIGRLVRAMPPHRVFAPDAETMGRAALLSGALCRRQGYQKDGRLRALHDCTLYLQAQKLGLTVLTANVGDYDILLQLVPTGRVLFYRL